jgi:hypothetical protein
MCGGSGLVNVPNGGLNPALGGLRVDTERLQRYAGWRGARRWRRKNLWLTMESSAAVLAFVLMVSSPFQRREPGHPRGHHG